VVNPISNLKFQISNRAQRMPPPRRKNIFRPPTAAPSTIYVRRGFHRVLAEEYAALKVKRAALVEDKMEAHSQGDLRENFGFKAAKDAIRAVDRKMDDLDRFSRRNTFIEVDPATWLTKPTDFLQLGHVTRIEKEDADTKKKHRFTFLVATYGETATDPESGIECLPHSSPLAAALLGLPVGKPTAVTLPAGPATLTVLSIRNPTQAELDRLLSAIKAPEVED
jgi:transcription elongation factor GreA